MATLDDALEACWAAEVARCERLDVPLPNKDRHLNMSAKYAMQALLLESCDKDGVYFVTRCAPPGRVALMSSDRDWMALKTILG